jgi:HK97 family phage portal protein
MRFFSRAAPEGTESPLGDTAWLNPVIDLMGMPSTSYVGAGALRNSDIFTAVRAISGDIASCPINVLADGVADESDNISYLLNNRPNQYYSGFSLKFVAIANMLLNRESVIQIVRDPRSKAPIALYFVKNSQVSILQSGAELQYQVYNQLTGNVYTLPATDVLHLKFMTLDGINGIGALYSLVTELQTQDGSKNYVKNFFSNNAAIGGTLKMNGVKLNDEELKQRAKTFSAMYAGAVNAGKIAAMDMTMDFNQLEVNADVLNFLNANTFTTKQVAKAFGLPLSRMGIETTNTSTDQDNLWYLQNTLSPYLNAFAAEVKFKTIMDNRDVAFNTDRILDIDPSKKATNLTKLQQAGVLTINDVLREYGRPNIGPVGDQHLVSLNYTDAEHLAEYQMARVKAMVKTPKAQEGGDPSAGKT